MRNVKSRPRGDHEAPSEESALIPSGYAASLPECHHIYPKEGGAALRRTTQYDCPPVRSTHGPKSTSTHPAVEPASADPWVRLLAEGNPPTVARRETPSTSLVPASTTYTETRVARKVDGTRKDSASHFPESTSSVPTMTSFATWRW